MKDHGISAQVSSPVVSPQPSLPATILNSVGYFLILTFSSPSYYPFFSLLHPILYQLRRRKGSLHPFMFPLMPPNVCLSPPAPFLTAIHLRPTAQFPLMIMLMMMSCSPSIIPNRRILLGTSTSPSLACYSTLISEQFTVSTTSARRQFFHRTSPIIFPLSIPSVLMLPTSRLFNPLAPNLELAQQKTFACPTSAPPR